MRGQKFGWICAAVVLAASVSTASFAQAAAGQPGAGRQGRGGGQGRFGGRGAAVTLANIPVGMLTSALKLTDEQQTKITAIQMKLQEDRRAASQGVNFQTATPEERTAMQTKNTEMTQTAIKAIEDVLTPDQKKQSAGLVKSISTLTALGIPAGVYGDLKLTDDQTTKLNDIAQDVAKDRTAKMEEAQKANAAGDTAKAQEIRRSLFSAQPNEKAMAVLTDTQKDTVTKYLKDHPQGGRGGGRRPGAPAAPAGT